MQVLTLSARDFSYRTQYDDGGDRKFDGKRRQTEAPTDEAKSAVSYLDARLIH